MVVLMGCCRCGGKKEELSVERDKCERERDVLQKTTKEEAGFFFFLDSIFSSLRSSTEHLFIGSGRG
jgi:hypothetical protein